MDPRQAEETSGGFPAPDGCPRGGHVDPGFINRTTTIIPTPSQPGKTAPHRLSFRFYPQSGLF
jgi:hypothetical protein